LELVCELGDENRDRFALLLPMRSGHLYCFDCAKRGCATKDEHDSGQKP